MQEVEITVFLKSKSHYPSRGKILIRHYKIANRHFQLPMNTPIESTKRDYGTYGNNETYGKSNNSVPYEKGFGCWVLGFR
jgi:hypothetical protein